MLIPKFDEHLSAPNLINIARIFFGEINDPRERSPRGFDLVSFLMSGIAIFFLKSDSLLSFCEDSQILYDNLKNIFGSLEVPSDTHFRTVVDQVETEQLKGIFKRYFLLLKDKKVFNKYSVLNNSLLVSIDGTGFFQSNKIHCAQCLQKKHRNGKISYEHQALPAVIVNPNIKEVIPIGVEFIEKQDGETKNDCERNASKRLLKQLRLDYPDQNFTIIEDGLSSNVPHVLELKENKMDFILGVKPGDHKKFFEMLLGLEKNSLLMTHSEIEESKNEMITRKFKYKNCLNLNQQKGEEVYINYFEVIEIVLNKKTQQEKKTVFSWITNIKITSANVLELMKLARARWMIENETFNTLKNQDYNFEHNYGHGKKNLTNNMCIFMFAAFLIDQIQQHCCKIFQMVFTEAKRKIRLWDYLRAHFFTHVNESLYDIYVKMIHSFAKRKRNLLDST